MYKNWKLKISHRKSSNTTVYKVVAKKEQVRQAVYFNKGESQVDNNHMSLLKNQFHDVTLWFWFGLGTKVTRLAKGNGPGLDYYQYLI